MIWLPLVVCHSISCLVSLNTCMAMIFFFSLSPHPQSPHLTHHATIYILTSIYYRKGYQDHSVDSETTHTTQLCTVACCYTWTRHYIYMFPFECFLSPVCPAVCVIQLNAFLTLFPTLSDLGAVKLHYFVSLSLM